MCKLPKKSGEWLWKGIFFTALLLFLWLLYDNQPEKYVEQNASVLTANKPLLFAHRGFTQYYPDNTLASLQAALHHDFTAVEIDIQHNHPGEFFLFHDKFFTNTDSTWYFKNEQKKVKPIDFSLSEMPAIQSIHQGDTIPTLYDIPALGQVFDHFGDSLLFYLDTKPYGYSHRRKSGSLLHSLLKEKGMLTQSLIANADFRFITGLEGRHPEVNTVLEGFYGKDRFLYRFIPPKFRPDFIACNAKKLDESFVKWLHSSGMIHRFIAYGVDGKNAKQLKKWGIEMMIVDEKY